MEFNLVTIVILFFCILGGWCLGYATCYAMVKGSNYDDNHELLAQIALLNEENKQLEDRNTELSKKNVNLHIELDALKAHKFPSV